MCNKAVVNKVITRFSINWHQHLVLAVCSVYTRVLHIPACHLMLNVLGNIWVLQNCLVPFLLMINCYTIKCSANSKLFNSVEREITQQDFPFSCASRSLPSMKKLQRPKARTGANYFQPLEECSHSPTSPDSMRKAHLTPLPYHLCHPNHKYKVFPRQISQTTGGIFIAIQRHFEFVNDYQQMRSFMSSVKKQVLVPLWF